MVGRYGVGRGLALGCGALNTSGEEVEVRHFNTPPGWPDPPNVRWRPPKHWGPEESWPSAPMDWPFWVDGDGRRVRGPLGRYGGPSLRPLAAPAILMVTVCGLVSFVLFGPFSGDDDPSKRADSPSLSDTELPPLPTVPMPTPGAQSVIISAAPMFHIAHSAIDHRLPDAVHCVDAAADHATTDYTVPHAADTSR